MSFTNRLIHEKSPYLLQHAHNPVDWYPWGQEAFDAAQKEQKPIFLSIGYATCHWCHVMETESFENLDVARELNETFINIKVDREELPDVDSIYMEFAQALMSSAGGWPLNVVLTPDLKPIFAVTYLPPKTRRGLMGLDEFIQQIKLLWQSEDRPRLIDQADKILELFEKTTKEMGSSEIPDENLLMHAFNVLFELADPVYGGIKGEPKFPLGYQIRLFLASAQSKNEGRALFYSELTLDMMSRGGIYDQLGGGFSRYSVDERWQIPHFEKMLYDNAILARTYLDAWRFTKKPLYRQITEEIIGYLLREMAHPGGGFYSAEDADTEGHEGLYYTWTQEEVFDLLGKDEGELFCRAYGITAKGNFEGRSVLHLVLPLEELDERLRVRLGASKEKLLNKRATRPRPFKDDKILAGWNGLVIDLLIRAGSAFQNEQYKAAALQTAEFIERTLWKEGHLLRRYRDGESRFSGGLDDYACMIHGVLSLYEEGCGSKWLKWALEMTHVLEQEFKIPGGAFYQSDSAAQLLFRKCEFYDGAEPSGNGVHSENLLRLYQITTNEKYLLQAEEILKAAHHHMQAYPPGSCYHFLALQRYLDAKAPTLVIVSGGKGVAKDEIEALLREIYSPHLTVVWKSSSENDVHPEKDAEEGNTTVYVCRGDRCEPPMTAKEEIIKAIEGL